MKLRTFKIIGAATIFTAVLALNSCQKEKAVVNTVTNDTPAVNQQSLQITTMFNEVLSVVEAAKSGNSFKNEGVLSNCAVVTIDSVSNPHSILIDFGTGCVSSDGSFRSGSIQAYYNFDTKSAFKTTTGAYVNATCSAYTIDNIQYNGTANINNDGPNGRGNLEFPIAINATIEDINTSITKSINATTKYEWLTGNTTSTKDDDQIALSGSYTGVEQSGSNYTVSILQPLIQNRADGCNQYPVAGQLQYQVGTQSAHLIDYGNGTCDDQATETVDGNTTTITLGQ
jgi:hypothetical protein